MAEINIQPYTVFSLTERSETSLVKKSLKALGLQIGFSPYQLAKLDIIISEITSNLFKHTSQQGEILFRMITQDGNQGIELISVDHGPGMADASHMMEDGVSTTQSLGTGMGAIRRLSDEFDIYSRKGWGTLLLSRIFKNKQQASPGDADVQFSTFMVAHPQEEVCGDGLSYKSQGQQHTFLLTDGLGHGIHAHEASRYAIEAFQQTDSTAPCQILQTIHDQLSHTRGAVGMAITVNTAGHTIDYCGVGNIAFRMTAPLVEKGKHGISSNGTLGHNIPARLTEERWVWHDPAWLIVHSDGIDMHWALKDYAGLLRKDLSLVAAALYKDYKRDRDDSTILVVKLNAAS